jgi:hypothetical protein
MAENGPQKQLLHEMSRVFKRFQKGGDLAPLEDRGDWDKLVEAEPPEQRELLKELAQFLDLWRYFHERDEKLGPEIVDAVSRLRNIPLPDRTAQLKEINRKLMERVDDAGSGTQFRQ